MKLALLFSTALWLAGCQTAYTPPSDGRASVIDIVLFPTSYTGQTVITHGYLQWRDGQANLFFDARHMDRLNTRFVVPLRLTGEAESSAAQCHGQEVLVKGIVEATSAGPSLTQVEDLVC